MTRRYPLAPLAAAAVMPLGTGLARRLGLSGTTWKQYRDHGVTERVADNLATKLGLHPYEVWPEMADHALADIEVTCADEKCNATFIPGHSWQKYCTDRCRIRARQRRQQATRRARNPERERERKQRWAADSTQYLRAYKARWNAANRDRVSESSRRYRARQKASAASEWQAPESGPPNAMQGENKDYKNNHKTTSDLGHQPAEGAQAPATMSRRTATLTA